LIVYTALIGDTDPLHEPAVSTDCRFVCFTDQDIKSKRWEIVRIQSSGGPTRTARMLKALPQTLFPQEDAWLWIDCCFEMLADPLAIHHTATEDIITFRHQYWNSISNEARAIVKLKKARPQAVFAQLAAYHKAGFDTPLNPQLSLSCTGVVYRRRTDQILNLNQFWAKQLRFSLRDQMSLDYCAWKLGITVGRWPGFVGDNPIARYNHYRKAVNENWLAE